MNKVFIEKCNAYDYVVMKKAIGNILGKCEDINHLKKGSTILLKANFVIKKSPDSAATTNPKFLRVLAELLINKGFSVIVGDSPGGIYTESFLKSVYRYVEL